MTEIFVPWKEVRRSVPDAHRNIDDYYVEQVKNYQTLEPLTVILKSFSNDSTALQIIFDSYVESYRKTATACRTSTQTALQKALGDTLMHSCIIFKVENSSYESWMIYEAGGITQKGELCHFMIFTNNYVVDVLSSKAPTIVL